MKSYSFLMSPLKDGNVMSLIISKHKIKQQCFIQKNNVYALVLFKSERDLNNNKNNIIHKIKFIE